MATNLVHRSIFGDFCLEAVISVCSSCGSIWSNKHAQLLVTMFYNCQGDKLLTDQSDFLIE